MVGGVFEENYYNPIYSKMISEGYEFKLGNNGRTTQPQMNEMCREYEKHLERMGKKDARKGKRASNEEGMEEEKPYSPNVYEKERLQNIRRNQERLNELIIRKNLLPALNVKVGTKGNTTIQQEKIKKPAQPPARVMERPRVQPGQMHNNIQHIIPERLTTVRTTIR